MRRHVIAFLLVCLASAALAQSPPPPKKPLAPAARSKSISPAPISSAASAPSICVASVVGHKFEVQTIGITVFGNALESTDTSAWGLDDLVVRKIGAIVGGHFAVRRLVLDRAAMAAYEAPKKSILEGGPLFRGTDKEFLDMGRRARTQMRLLSCDR